MQKSNSILLLFFIILMSFSSVIAQEVCTRDSFFPQAGNCGYDVQDYLLEMTWDLEGDHWEVSETAIFISEWDTDELWFDFTDAYEITALTVNGSPAEYDREPTKLIVHYNFAHDTEYKLSASFNGKLQWGELFDKNGESRDPEDGFCMINEPTNAWRYYICNDHPKDKATFHYTFTVPAAYVPAGVGRLLSMEEASGALILPGETYTRNWNPGTGNGTVTFSYVQDTPTAPYLFTVCAGAFDMKLTTLEDGKVKLDFVDRGHSNPDLAWSLADLQTETISSLEPFFGPYPYEDLGAIFAKTHLGAALETQTRSLYDSSSTSESTIAHEITHQWIGDLISLADWSDLCIKEGAAKYGEALWMEYKDGKEAYETEILRLYETIANGERHHLPLDDDMTGYLKSLSSKPLDTLYDHDAAVGAIANYCQIDRDDVQLKEDDVTIDEWIEGLTASCDEIWIGDISNKPFYEMLGIPTHNLTQDHYDGPKDIATEDVIQLYGRPVYYGGAIVYHCLRARLGDELFKEGLQTLIEENKWGTVSEETFIEAFSRVSGEDLSGFIKSYLYYGELGHIPDLLGIETWEEARAKFDR